MAKITKINHIGIAVSKTEDALAFWTEIMGINPDHSEVTPDNNSKITFLPVGESDIELVEPLNENAATAKFIAEKGPGIHHLCLETDDIAGMLADLKAKGIRLINETPTEMTGRKVAFVHPRSTGGVLVELYQVVK
jgi:methylmalonyl-CoA/ethylmalonyl-CoA epimerase